MRKLTGSCFRSILHLIHLFETYELILTQLLFKELLQGSVETQMTLLKRLDMHIEDMRSRIGIDVAKSSMSTYIYTRRYLGEYIQKRFKTSDVAFGQLNEHIPWEFQDYIMKDKDLRRYGRHYLAILKKICRMAFKEGYAEKRYL